jgi:WD40 repeat protein
VNIWYSASGKFASALSGHKDPERQRQADEAARELSKAGNIDKLLNRALKGDAAADRATSLLSWPSVIAFSRSGHLVAAGDCDGYARVWDLASRTVVAEFHAGEDVTQYKCEGLRRLSFSPTDKTLTVEALTRVDGTSTLTIWDLASRQIVRSFTRVRTSDVSHDGRVLAFALDTERQVALWDLEQMTPIGTILEGFATRASNPLYWIRLSPTGSTIALGLDGNQRTEDGRVVVREAPSGRVLWQQDPLLWRIEPVAPEFPGFPSRPSARFSPNGKTVVMYFNTPEWPDGFLGGNSKDPKDPVLKSASTGEVVARLALFNSRGVATSLEPFVMSPDGRLMATLVADDSRSWKPDDFKKNSELRVWDARDGALKYTIKQESPIEFAPDDGTLLTWTRRGELRLWDLERVRPLWTLRDYERENIAR